MSIVKDSISEQIYDLIKNDIILQEMKLGDQIDTKKIAEEHNISVMPVRDALQKLESQGLVSKKSRVGFFVRSFSEKEIKEIMEARKMYEIYSIEEHFSSINRLKLRKIFNELNRTENMSRTRFDELDDTIHTLIITASGNDYLINNFNKINDLIILFRHLDKDRIRNANKEHKELIEAVLDNELAESKQLLKYHIDQVTRSILEHL